MSANDTMILKDASAPESDLRPYISGADVMATWHRVTGWIPPSRDPRYIKKWLDFQLEMLDSRRRAIEAQFSLNFLKETDPDLSYGLHARAEFHALNDAKFPTN